LINYESELISLSRAWNAAFTFGGLRRILGIKWQGKVINATVLEQAGSG